MIHQAVSPYATPGPTIDSGPPPADSLTVAGRRSRLTAALLDALLLLPVAVGGLVLHGLLQRPPGETPRSTSSGAILALAITLLYFGTIFIYQVVMLSRRGQTFGKRAMKIRVVKLDGTQPGFVHAVLLRLIVNALPPAIPVVGSLYTLVDLLFIFRADRRCLHDLIAGTRVVQAEAPPSQ